LAPLCDREERKMARKRKGERNGEKRRIKKKGGELVEKGETRKMGKLRKRRKGI